MKDCTFNAITTSNIEVIDLSMEKNVALTFEGSNVFDGRVATDADKPEGAADMKLYSTQSIKAYRAKTVNGPAHRCFVPVSGSSYLFAGFRGSRWAAGHTSQTRLQCCAG